MSLPSAAVQTRFLEAVRAGRLQEKGVRTGRSEAGAGDAVVELDLAVAGGHITAASFRAFGCPATIAAADWVCEWLPGRTMDAARGLSVEEVEQGLALAASRRLAAVVVLEAMAWALADP